VYDVDNKELRLLNLQRADLLARRRYFLTNKYGNKFVTTEDICEHETTRSRLRGGDVGCARVWPIRPNGTAIELLLEPGSYARTSRFIGSGFKY